MADPDLQIRGEGGGEEGGHPDPEIRGAGTGLQKNSFFGLKIRGRPGPPGSLP